MIKKRWIEYGKNPIFLWQERFLRLHYGEIERIWEEINKKFPLPENYEYYFSEGGSIQFREKEE